MRAGLFTTFLTFLLLSFSESRAQVGTITSNLNDTVCNGATGLLTANGVVGSVTTWQYQVSGWQNIPSSAGNTTQSFFMIPNNLCYRFIHNNGQDTSAIYCITVDDSSQAGAITGGGAQCGMANGSLTVSGTNGNPLGWYSSTGGPFTNLGNTSNTQAFNVTQTTTYAYITKNGVCPADTAFDTISITPYSNGGILSPATSTVCATSNTVTITASGTTGTIEEWQSAPSASGPWNTLPGTSTTYSTTNLASTTYYQLIVKSGICPEDTSTIAVVNVDQAPVGGTLSGGTYFCGPPPATGTLTLNGYSGNIIQWEFNTGSGWSTSPCTGNTCTYNTSTMVAYRVQVGNGVCPSVYSDIDTIGVSAPTVAGTLTLTEDTLCAFFGSSTLTLTGSTANQYHWEYSTNGTTWIPVPSFTGTTAVFANLPPGYFYYHVVVQNNLCPPAVSNVVNMQVNPSPTVTILTPDTIIEPGQTISVTALGTGSPVWTPPNGVEDPNSFTTNITAFFPTSYAITVDDGSGCIGTDTIHIYMTVAPFSGFIANTLTPNNDGINDAFYIENIEVYVDNSLEIFNEYGQSIYSASPYKNDWKGTYNGSRVPDGTYYYVLKLKDLNKNLELKGFITILGGK